FAHINSCHYSGRMSLDFAEFLLANDVTLAVPTHTNASLIDCGSPSVRPEQQTPTEVEGAGRLMEIYEQLGCTPMWSCAPYQHDEARPAFGQHIVGSESNAVSFFNSVLGARTNKYGDMLDISAALVGRVPLAGLHTDEGRIGTHVFRLVDLPDESLADPTFPHVLGIILGREAGTAIPVIEGLPAATEDELKAIAAAGATAGSVEMFHVVGITPEASTLAEALGGVRAQTETRVDAAMLAETRASLSTGAGKLNAVCLGTPHFSVAEFSDLVHALGGRQVHPNVTMLVTTSRAVATEIKLRGWHDQLGDAGVQIVLDTCTYYTPRPAGVEGLVMTNSAKWAYYAPGILDVDVAFGSLNDCVGAAIDGEVAR
ncbi:MAG: aconitase X catalytic domain-containing protein, partial [Acidimicrobiia bacterium]|nr:aconitase X catalytic domain-containing protein [Acidimicrobiia bacterium]